MLALILFTCARTPVEGPEPGLCDEFDDACQEYVVRLEQGPFLARQRAQQVRQRACARGQELDCPRAPSAAPPKSSEPSYETRTLGTPGGRLKPWGDGVVQLGSPYLVAWDGVSDPSVATWAELRAPSSLHDVVDVDGVLHGVVLPFFNSHTWRDDRRAMRTIGLWNAVEGVREVNLDAPGLCLPVAVYREGLLAPVAYGDGVCKGNRGLAWVDWTGRVRAVLPGPPGGERIIEVTVTPETVAATRYDGSVWVRPRGASQPWKQLPTWGLQVRVAGRAAVVWTRSGSATSDMKRHRWSLIRLTDGEPLHVAGDWGTPRAVSLSPNGEFLALSIRKQVRLLRTSDGSEAHPPLDVDPYALSLRDDLAAVFMGSIEALWLQSPEASTLPALTVTSPLAASRPPAPPKTRLYLGTLWDRWEARIEEGQFTGWRGPDGYGQTPGYRPGRLEVPAGSTVRHRLRTGEAVEKTWSHDGWMDVEGPVVVQLPDGMLGVSTRVGMHRVAADDPRIHRFRVETEDGRPVAGATLVPRGRGVFGGQSWTGPDGSGFLFEDPKSSGDAPVIRHLYTSPWRLKRFRVREADDGTTVYILPATTLHVTGIPDDDGLAWVGGNGRRWHAAALDVGWQTRAGIVEDGRWTLARLRGATYEVVHLDGSERWSYRRVEAAPGTEREVPPAWVHPATLRVRVMSVDGWPASGAQVRAFPVQYPIAALRRPRKDSSRDLRGPPPGVTWEATTDLEGEVVLTGLPSGVTVIEAHDPTFRLDGRVRVELEPGEPHQVTLPTRGTRTGGFGAGCIVLETGELRLQEGSRVVEVDGATTESWSWLECSVALLDNDEPRTIVWEMPGEGRKTKTLPAPKRCRTDADYAMVCE
ncbi:MAG: hypothetical protein AAF602_14385 [Myxococcota bacterium]